MAAREGGGDGCGAVVLGDFDAILFDLNGTLAEAYDRFGPGEDYHGTYRRLGGSRLAAAELTRLVERTLGAVLARYRDGPPDPFPALRDCVPYDDPALAGELELLLETIAVHECGQIPAPRAALLRKLARRHRLGLVSDLWAPAGRCRRYLAAAGLAGLFGCLVFSCEHGAVKPAPRLFERALTALGADPARTLFVGDDPARDIAGAAACGMKTVRVGAPGAAGAADWVVRDVLELWG
jgi:putative hydrolase of the HAD superfamily/5'-nucleotidase